MVGEPYISVLSLGRLRPWEFQVKSALVASEELSRFLEKSDKSPSLVCVRVPTGWVKFI